MKKYFLFVAFAVLIAVVGAFATTSRNVADDAFGRNNSNICVPGTVVESNCDPALVTGIQCQVMISGQSKPAYSNATCSTQLKRPL